jgi:hypothetical protein
MVQWGIQTVTYGSEWYPAGTIFRSPHVPLTLPTTFIDTNYSFTYTVYHAASPYALWAGQIYSSSGVTPDTVVINVLSADNTSPFDISTHFQAIGRWK